MSTTASPFVTDVPLEQVAEILEKAAENYEAEEVEWCKGVVFKSPTASRVKFSVCAWGALIFADLQLRGEVITPRRFVGPSDRVMATMVHIQNRLQHYLLASWNDQHYLLASWNDQHYLLASWNDLIVQDKQEVIDLFKETAKDMRNANNEVL